MKRRGTGYQFSIAGTADRLGQFQVSNPKGAGEKQRGMTVEMINPPLACGVLLGVKALQEVTDIFALYLRQYPGVRITYDNVVLDPANAEHGFARYTLDEMVMENGERVQAKLEVVEWNLPGKRGVYLCDEHGFMRHNALPRLHYRGFSYTAYVKTSHVTTLNSEGIPPGGRSGFRRAPAPGRRPHEAARALQHAGSQARHGHAGEMAGRRYLPLPQCTARRARSQRAAYLHIYATHLHQNIPRLRHCKPPQQTAHPVAAEGTCGRGADPRRAGPGSDYTTSRKKKKKRFWS